MTVRPDVSRLDTHRGNLRALTADTERMAAAWPLGGGATVVEVCGVTHRLLDGTAPETVRGLAGAVAQQARFTRQYVDATARVDAAMEGLCAAVAIVGDEQDPARATLPRQATLDLLTELDHLLDALQRLAEERHHGEGWTADVQQIVGKVRIEVATLRGITRRAMKGTAQEDPHPATPSADSAVRLGTVLGKRAFQERCVGEAMRAATVLMLFVIAALAYSVLWRSPLDVAALALDLAKLATVLPLALLALYLKQESAFHRASAARLRELEIQLSHVDTFFAPEEHSEQRAAIWSRLTLVLPTPDSTTPALEKDLPTILERLTELLKSLGLPSR